MSRSVIVLRVMASQAKAGAQPSDPDRQHDTDAERDADPHDAVECSTTTVAAT
jgi:hypothetical protein